jgi:hypothetical protein
VRLTKQQLAEWWSKVGPAAFSCRIGPAIGRSATANVYPLKSGKGWMWVIWDKVDPNMFNIEANLQSGGTTSRPFDRACRLALSELIEYKGRRK